ncbi:MAG: glycosyltransferase [Kiritimatiellae bacterium]|nr:glycosyltransferase [Kiritimatiellia bacterium]
MIKIQRLFVHEMLMPNAEEKKPDAQPMIPIIVPFPTWDDWVAECIAGCAELDYPDVEIYLLPDEPLPTDRAEEARRLAKGRAVHILPTGRGNPAQKRNVALRASSAPWAALIDADAFPRADWLKNATAEATEEVGIVAGPNITPPNDPLSRQISGLVMRSALGFGAGYIRHYPVARHEIEEMPTCNMIIRRLPDLFFREEFATAEDMMYCRDTRERGYKIIYSPEVVVFHHRRTFPIQFARQFFFYGRDKGRLTARGHSSARLGHAMPAGLLLYAIATLVFALIHPLPLWWLLPAAVYAVAVVVESVRHAHTPLLALCGLLGFPVAHASYGYGYLRGLPIGWRERKQ